MLKQVQHDKLREDLDSTPGFKIAILHPCPSTNNNTNPMWYRTTAEGLLVTVVVLPASSRDEVVGVHGDALKVKVVTAPERGKATERVRKLLAEYFSVKSSAVSVVRGETTHQKELLVCGVTEPPVTV